MPYHMLSAQPATRDVIVEAGALDARQRTGSSASAAMMSALARASWERTSVEGFAVLVSAAENGSASQFGAGANLLMPKLDAARLETGASATLFGALGSASGGRQWSAFARQHFEFTRWGAFAGAGVARATRAGEGVRAHAFDAGAWGNYGRFSVSALAQRSMTNDFQLMEAADYYLSRPARAYHVQDLTLQLSHQGARFDMYAAQAWRSSLGATFGSSRTATLGAAWHVTPNWSLALTTGTQLADLVRGLPESWVRTVSLRWQRASRRARGLTIPVRDQVRGADVAASSMRPEREASLTQSNGVPQIELRITAPADARVEVAGTFNDWQPVALTFDGRHHVALVPVSRGPHRVSVRVDGGTWRAPAGLVRMQDDLGGESGLLVVP